MPYICIVDGCESKAKVYSAVMFHRFPNDPKQRKAWLVALNMNPTRRRQKTKNWRVCSKHFTENDYTSGLRLKHTATPTVFTPRREMTILQQCGPSPAAEPDPAAAAVMDMSAASVLDVSMTSEGAVDSADISFVPYSTPSSSSTSGSSSSFSGEPGPCKERKWIVNESKLLELFEKCPTCSSVMCDVNQTITRTGSRISIIWQCNNGHMGEWESCPSERGTAENNLLAAAATVFTGSTYADIADWARLFNLQLPHKTAFYNIQSSHLFPVIEEAYIKQEDVIKARLFCQSEDGERVQLSADGRSDGPRRSSDYNTYSFMDDSTKQIVGFELTQVSQASASVAVEPLGFRTGLQRILNEGIDVKVVTTDRHSSIRKIMREEYPRIIHQFHPWHVAKGLKKKMVAASKRKDCKDLARWIKSVSSHMWWSCCTSKGDVKELLRRWMSLQYHVTGVHRWEDDGTEHKCFHKDLSAQKQSSKRWLNVNSPSFKALRSVMLDPGLLTDLQQMTFFKHTGELEAFHRALLKYCPKRLHFQFPAMKARTMLAVMDHNENHSTNRAQATTAAGPPRSNVVFKKQTQQWISRPMNKETTQMFRDELMERVLQRLSHIQ